jgi:hypothetical protein
LLTNSDHGAAAVVVERKLGCADAAGHLHVTIYCVNITLQNSVVDPDPVGSASFCGSGSVSISTKCQEKLDTVFQKISICYPKY